ncbi:DUF3108 domain-containing protein [Parvularcula flava]|uniref:DUF3108 domain-containing protein n=1 Tax=Aquisalinus luteolus TaxID=1566827 RepID=A0A8J3A230_9PROT|nr:DUF3108 domain-containing protein [Aquisalinus luteolus]NHK27061.1 DUF3108 domain-containing protein [Aquisalinus luteolus]GGH94247.1 hypothetical protein GCM10011355_07980 [Aquisalinus luteolus]
MKHTLRKISRKSLIGATALAGLSLGAAAFAQVSLSTDVNLPVNSPEWKEHFAVDFIFERPAVPAVPLSDAVRYEATYKGTAAGLSVGNIRMVADIGSEAYKIDYRIEQKGVARWFSQTETDSLSVGTLKDGKLTSLFYQKLEEEGDDHQYVDLVRNSADNRFSLWSDPQYDLYWPVPVEYAAGTVDPIGAQIMMGFTDTPEGKDPCDRVLKIYDGKRRWDMTISRDGSNDLRSRDGYTGPAIRCKIRQKRVAGFKPEKIAESMPDGEVYLAPVPEELRTTNFTYVPVRMEGDYGIINARLEAQDIRITGPDGKSYKLGK